MITRESLAEQILRPRKPQATRILFLAEYAPDAPDFRPRTHEGDGGYPLYHYWIWQGLKDIGYDVKSSSKPYSVLFASGNIDFVFSLYNRMPLNNSEVVVSAFCEYMRIPYLGARTNIRALAEDKWLSKLVARSVGIPTNPGRPYASIYSLNEAPAFRGPYFVKARFGAASEGIDIDCLQDTWSDIKRTAKRFLDRGVEVLVEQYAAGLDITVPVLGNTLPLVLGFVHCRSDKPGNILTEDLKMDDPLGYALHDVGAQNDHFYADVRALWSATGPMDYVRLDYRVNPDTDERVFLEFNVCCFLGASGAICLAGEQRGLSQLEILGHVVEHGLERQRLGREHLAWVL